MTLTKKIGAEFIGTFWLELSTDGLKLRKMTNKVKSLGW